MPKFQEICKPTKMSANDYHRDLTELLNLATDALSDEELLLFFAQSISYLSTLNAFKLSERKGKTNTGSTGADPA